MPPSSTPAAPQPELPPQRLRVLLNAGAGSASAARGEPLSDVLASAFSAHGIAADIRAVTPESIALEAGNACREALAGRLDAVIAAGGDGTIGAIAGALADTGVPMGIIPLGTFNNFAKDVGLPRELGEAVEVIARGHVTAVDAAEVNGRVFVNNSSIGVYPFLVIDRERRRRRGLWKWVAMLFAAARAARYLPMRRLHIKAGNTVEDHRSPCLFVGNNQYNLTGFDLGRRHDLTSGTLSLHIARPRSAVSLAWLALRCMLGLFEAERDLRTLIVKELVISSRKRRLLVAFDGEVERINTPLRYRTRPAALNVFCPARTDAEPAPAGEETTVSTGDTERFLLSPRTISRILRSR
ncbi:diacylglycerol kinase family protein [Bradyrhizobium sp. LHD-71]|uniref:diacylglycerol/lipid kinase family protein n=1 Tax=Bradyrhizobium sp. LHD-71 TaxID=3072141 RepID=UPI00280ECD25|nr:diacylglycerol kinase family protein [Bradyrhizobium sp. LHD-71]MDQ8730531.1 diacylglycerol kinase family protein [Bradyrhizobium sp. LHD-71]